MKKFFFLALALAVCAFTFVSCEKEKDKDNSSDSNSNYAQAIVGTWQFTRYWDGEERVWYDVDEEEFDLRRFIFDSKGFLTIQYTGGYSYRSKYHIEKDIIYIGDEEDKDSEWKDWDEFYKISSISSSKMVLLDIDCDDKMEFEKQ